MISSPAVSSRPSTRLSAKLSVVMFAPNTTSAGLQLKKRAPAAFDRSRIDSTRWPVGYGAPRFALASRSVVAIAVPTSSGTCDPPGASKKPKPV